MRAPAEALTRAERLRRLDCGIPVSAVGLGGILWLVADDGQGGVHDRRVKLCAGRFTPVSLMAETAASWRRTQWVRRERRRGRRPCRWVWNAPTSQAFVDRGKPRWSVDGQFPPAPIAGLPRSRG